MTATVRPEDLEDDTARPHGRGLDLVTRRSLLDDAIEVGFRLGPGDRPLVSTGDAIVAGTTIAERLRDPHLVELPTSATGDDARPGARWTAAGEASRLRRTLGTDSGELAFEHGGHWMVAVGELVEPIDCP